MKKKYTSASSGSKPRVITDAKHFLAQTWWRTPSPKKQSSKREKRVANMIPASTFSLQQCVVMTENIAERGRVPIKAMEIKDKMMQQNFNERKSTRKASSASLKLRCPICNESFKSSPWMVGH